MTTRFESPSLALALLLALVGCDTPTAADPSVAMSPMALHELDLERAPREPYGELAREGVTLLHFWATWCAPCREELPALLDATRDARGVTAVAVTQEDWARVESYFAPDAVPPEIARDPDGSLARHLGVAPLPDTYVVDAEGVARRRIHGAREWRDPRLRAWLAQLGANAEAR